MKKNLGEKQFKELINELKSKNQSFRSVKKNRYFENENNQNKAVKNEKIYPDISINHNSEEDFSSTNQFIEITPLNYEIENVPQKDLSSVPISDIEFPPSVFMIVDKKTELVVKYLKEYQFGIFLQKMN